jgi:hypothetical protein
MGNIIIGPTNQGGMRFQYFPQGASKKNLKRPIEKPTTGPTIIAEMGIPNGPYERMIVTETMDTLSQSCNSDFSHCASEHTSDDPVLSKEDSNISVTERYMKEMIQISKEAGHHSSSTNQALRFIQKKLDIIAEKADQ